MQSTSSSNDPAYDSKVESSAAFGIAEALSNAYDASVGILIQDASRLNQEHHWVARRGLSTTPWIASTEAGELRSKIDWTTIQTYDWEPEGAPRDHIWRIVRLNSLEESGPGSATAWIRIDRTPIKKAWKDLRTSSISSWRKRGDFSTSPGDLSEGERWQTPLMDRLIRALQVSEPPERFQRRASEALRQASGVELVGWVPRSHRENVVFAGTIEGLTSELLRSLVTRQPNANEANWAVLNTDDLPGLRSLMIVPSDPSSPSGWLVVASPVADREFGVEEAKILRPIANLIASQRSNARHYAELKELLFGVIRSLTAAIEAKDPYTLGHSERVGRIAVRLGEALGLSADERGDLYLAGLLHDVGKIGVRDEVLQKPGSLSREEYREIQEHVRIGVEILADLKKLHHLLPGVASHHENYDGSGYPDKLSGMEIPMLGRILAVADAFDAMSSTRPYRHQLSPQKITTIFEKGAGKQWDPVVVEALFACRSHVERIRQKGLGESVKQVVDATVGRPQPGSRVNGSKGFPPNLLGTAQS